MEKPANSERDGFSDYIEQDVGDFNPKAEAQEDNPPPRSGQDPRNIAMPAYHRQLYPGEELRRGDQAVYLGRRGWRDILPDHRGQTVPESTEKNGWLRYCIPVHATFQLWYVDQDEAAEKKCPPAIGTIDDPFPSAETAKTAIENSFKNLDHAPFGLVVDMQGSPLFAYDLPEPEERNQTEEPEWEKPPIETPEIPADYRQLKRTEKIRRGDLVPHLGKWVLADAFTGNRALGSIVIRKRAQHDPHRYKRETPPDGFGILAPHATIKQGDRIWTEGRWIPAATSVGQEVGDRKVCRKGETAGQTDHQQESLGSDHHLEKIADLLEEILAELRGQRQAD